MVVTAVGSQVDLTREDGMGRGPLGGPARLRQQPVEPGQVLAPLHQRHPELVRADRVAEIQQELLGLHGWWGEGWDTERVPGGSLLLTSVLSRKLCVVEFFC
jgi:hypothetical protein